MAQRKPNSVKRREGNPGKHHLGEDWKPVPGAPECPSWLAGEALLEWQRVVELLDAEGLITQFDRPSLVDYCVCWARVCDAERDVSARGLFVAGYRKAKTKN